MAAHERQRNRSFFTRAEVARLFEVAPNTVNRWVLGGKLPSVLTPGGRRRYPVGPILQLVADLTQGDADAAARRLRSKKRPAR